MSRKSDEPKFQGTETEKNSSFEERSRSLFSSLDECTKITPQSSLYQKKSHNNERSNDSSQASRRDTEDFREVFQCGLACLWSRPFFPRLRFALM